MDIRALFSSFGPIEHIKLLPDKNCAFVNYEGVDHAVAVRTLSGGSLGVVFCFFHQKSQLSKFFV